MDLRPYIVATVYVIGLALIVIFPVHVGYVVLYTLVGGFFALMFGFLHRVDLAAKKSTKQSMMFNPPSLEDPHTQAEIAEARKSVQRN